MRILVIEDEDNVRRFLEVTLTRLGHRPVLAADAQQGFSAFARERFDAVVTDLGLPGIDGKEVARTIARKAPGTPVILLTGWADQLQAENEVIEGVTRILGKPIAIDTLSATLSAVCCPVSN